LLVAIRGLRVRAGIVAAIEDAAAIRKGKGGAGMGGPSLIIMAAGMGRRYGGLKQVEPIGPGGELIVDYSTFDALRAGFERVVFVVREEIEASFRERFDPILSKRCNVAYVVQRLEDLPDGFTVPADRAKPWGTAQAVLACRDVVDGPFAVINADDLYGRKAFAVLGQYLDGEGSTANEAALVGYRLTQTLTEQGTVSRGVCYVGADGYLIRIDERKHVRRSGEGAAFSENGETWCEIRADATASMNMWGFRPPFFDKLESRFSGFLADCTTDIGSAEFLLPTVIGGLIADRAVRVRVLPSNAQWFGITYREDVAKVRCEIARLVTEGEYPSALWGG